MHSMLRRTDTTGEEWEMANSGLASREAAVVDAVPKDLFIGGKWRSAAGGRTLPVHDPATGEVLCEVADATSADGMEALDAAVAAQPAWAAYAPRERGEILRRAYQILVDRADDLALLMTLEMGKPVAEAKGEVLYAAEFFRWFAEEAVRIDGGYATAPNGSGRFLVMKQPVGPCVLITPWNFPMALGGRKLGPAIDAGGVMEPLIRDGRARKLSFTGSTGVGRKLLEQASEQVLRTSMELGGNAPFLVFDDADMDAAIDGAMLAKMRNIGEACTAANRFYVQRGVAEEFSRRLTERMAAQKIGRGTEDGVIVGPLIDQSAIDKVTELVSDAVERGATVLTGGEKLDGAGHFYPPTVLTDVPQDSRMTHEEIFGPVAPITVFDTEDEAVAEANDTEFGLVSYLYTADLKRALRVCEKLETGMIGLNQGIVSNPAVPFGGVKQSGIGREGGTVGIEEFLEIKYVAVAL